MDAGTASRAAGVRLKKMRGSLLRCVMNRTDGQRLFSFWPSETSRELRVLLEEENLPTAIPALEQAPMKLKLAEGVYNRMWAMGQLLAPGGFG